jgi:hypothetical protein
MFTFQFIDTGIYMFVFIMTTNDVFYTITFWSVFSIYDFPATSYIIFKLKISCNCKLILEDINPFNAAEFLIYFHQHRFNVSSSKAVFTMVRLRFRLRQFSIRTHVIKWKCSQSSVYVHVYIYVDNLVGPCSDLSVKTDGIFVILTSLFVLFILEKKVLNIELLCKIIQNISTKINYYIFVLY